MKIPKAGKSMAPKAAIKGYTPETAAKAAAEMKPEKKPAEDAHTRKLAVETDYLFRVKKTITETMEQGGITKPKLAHRVGITEETLQRTIFAANANPTVQQVGRVAAALGLLPQFAMVKPREPK